MRTQNVIISKALNEKDILLREIHHRVKNNLQFISSLLGLQSEHTSDQVALGALQEGQDRVQSMALIHQNLYPEDNLTGRTCRLISLN
jgi:two-component sensor histidine kinase